MSNISRQARNKDDPEEELCAVLGNSISGASFHIMWFLCGLLCITSIYEAFDFLFKTSTDL